MLSKTKDAWRHHYYPHSSTRFGKCRSAEIVINFCGRSSRRQKISRFRRYQSANTLASKLRLQQVVRRRWQKILDMIVSTVFYSRIWSLRRDFHTTKVLIPICRLLTGSSWYRYLCQELQKTDPPLYYSEILGFHLSFYMFRTWKGIFLKI